MMELIAEPKVQEIISAYPTEAQQKLMELRQLIIDTASEIGGIKKIRETLKWGEPSYVVNKGSTIRIDWKKKNPEFCAVYFICSTSLVSTFRILYSDALEFEDNRAILLPINEPTPTNVLKHCLSLALTYHNIKDLPMLGA